MKQLATSQPFDLGYISISPDDMRYVMMSVSLIIHILVALGRVIEVTGLAVDWAAEASGPVVETWEAGIEFWIDVGWLLLGGRR